MRILKRLIFGLILLIATFTAVGMLLPRHIEVSRSISINSSAENVFYFVNNLERTKHWSPWLGLDPDVTLTFNDIPEGVGAAMTWASENRDVGSGRMEITRSDPFEQIDVALDFGDMGSADAFWEFDQSDTATEVTWGFKTDMGAGPVGRWMGLMMDRWVGADYQRGLENLKRLVEAGA